MLVCYVDDERGEATCEGQCVMHYANAKCKMQNAKCKIMLANATAMMTAMQSQLCFAYANRNYVPKGNANFTTLRFAHKEK